MTTVLTILASPQAIMRAFSREALELYIPVIQEEIRAAVNEWLARDSCVLVYPEMKRLMFRIAMRILLGFEPEQIRTDERQLVEAFEEMIKNLFSLPIDVPFSGLYRVRKTSFAFFRLTRQMDGDTGCAILKS